MKIAVQMYSFGNEIEKIGLENVLKLISESGVTGIELAGSYGLSGEEIKKLADKAGLQIVSAHIPFDEISEKTDCVIKFALACGFKTVVVPWLSLDELKNNFFEVIEKLNAALIKLKASGITLAYHNHDFEFANNENYLIKFHQALPALFFQTDLCWLKVGGQSFDDLAHKLNGMILFPHIKEVDASLKEELPAVKLGEGVAEITAAINYAVEKKMDWVVIEAEGIQGDAKEYLSSAVKYILNCEKR